MDYLIVDEAGFLAAEQVDQLAELADDWHVDVYCFGLATDFRTRLLPGAQRLIELADEIAPVHVEVEVPVLYQLMAEILPLDPIAIVSLQLEFAASADIVQMICDRAELV